MPPGVHAANGVPWPAEIWIRRHASTRSHSAVTFREIGWGCFPGNQSSFGAQVVRLSHRYRFIFVLTAKAASTSTVQHLEAILCDAWRMENAHNTSDTVGSCRGITFWDEWPAHNSTEITRIWSEYFVFSIVRNVWS